MTDVVVGVAAGAALGTLYFGGLWLTLTRAEVSDRPALLIGGSYLLRLTVAGAGFGLLAVQGIGAAAAGLAGFLLARTVLVNRLGPRREDGSGGGRGEERRRLFGGAPERTTRRRKGA